MRLLRLKALIALSIVQFLFVSASLSHDENTPRGVHIVASQLYQVSLDDVDDNVVAHNYNNFRNGEGEDWSEDLSGYEGGHLKCYRLFRPKFRKVKTSFFAQIPQVSNTLTPSEGVCDYTPV